MLSYFFTLSVLILSVDSAPAAGPAIIRRDNVSTHRVLQPSNRIAPSALSVPQSVFSVPSDAQASSSTPPVVMGYYPDWAGPSFPPEKVDFTRFDWIDFAFAIPDDKFELTWDDPVGAPDKLQRLVTTAHRAGKSVKLSIGGWTGSKYFSSAVSSAENRTTFVNDIIRKYAAFNLDGIEIDWEYPGRSGQEGNVMNSNDSANYLLLLKQLRAALPPTARLTSAVQTTPFAGPDGAPLKDLSAFASVLDWVLLMNYDVWGYSANPGPNAPMSNGCHNSTQPNANAAAAFNAWTTAGFPPNKLVLGLPAYGYVSKSTAQSLQSRENSNSRIFKSPRARGMNVTLQAENSQIQFRALVEQGALTLSSAPDQPLYVGAGGYVRRWDKCSSSPFLRSESAGQVVTYDDSESLKLKAKLVKDLGMLGVNMFDVTGDTDRWDLIDSARNGLGM